MALQRASKNNNTNFKFSAAGDSIKGYYLGQVSKTINGMPAIEHTYKTSSGTLAVLGQANILKQLSNNGVTPGTYVEIRFSGETVKLKGGKTMKVYDVDFDLEDRVTTSSSSGAEGSEWDEGEDSEEPSDEITPSRPVAANTATVPSTEKQARLNALLSKHRGA